MSQSRRSKLPAPPENARCRFATAPGRRCRLRITHPKLGLCHRHGPEDTPNDIQDLSPAFAMSLGGLKTAAAIHDFLATLAMLLIQDRISARRASVLAYTASLLLRTLLFIDHEQDYLSHSTDQEPCIILDVPRPDRSQPSSHPGEAHQSSILAHAIAPTGRRRRVKLLAPGLRMFV